MTVLYQVLEGLAYIHSRHVIHRDLKPANVLIDGKSVKIADFGNACFETPGKPKDLDITTLWWRAPEMLACNPHYTSAVDLWAAGIVLYELVVGRVPFEFAEGGDENGKALSTLIDYYGQTGPLYTIAVAGKMLNRLLEFEAARRISAEDALVL